MNWRAYALRFGFQLALRSLLRARRGVAEKVGAVTMLTPLAVGSVAAVQVVWHLTGRARRVRHALGFDQIVVLPFPRQDPDELRARVGELLERASAQPAP